MFLYLAEELADHLQELGVKDEGGINDPILWQVATYNYVFE